LNKLLNEQKGCSGDRKISPNASGKFVGSNSGKNSNSDIKDQTMSGQREISEIL
jgi:hypothetical protein